MSTPFLQFHPQLVGWFLAFVFAPFCFAGEALAQSTADSSALALKKNPDSSALALKKLSLEQLMDIEVTLVSKRPEKLAETASAIQVITNEDIKRSGAIYLPEALRLASNLQTGQTNSHDWAVTARGFNGAPLSNNTLSNKLLVMIDGRSVYTPLFGGVFWDVQNRLLEDIDRIEVISGPGGTLWGANAVNGVINVIAKPARATQGLYVSAAAGSFLRNLAAVRYGGSVGPKLFYRVNAQRLARYGTTIFGSDGQDAWHMIQGGFRADYRQSDASMITVQGNVYGGSEGTPTSTQVDGQNVLGRWTRSFSEKSDLSLQLYADRTWRDLPAVEFNEQLNTYDGDFQHRFPLGERQSVLWGVGYRVMQNQVNNVSAISLTPPTRTMQMFNGFVQNEALLIPNKLKVTVGSKLEHNDFSGVEIQPSVRGAWTLARRQTVWAAISRAVRSPTRFDSDILTPLIVGDKNFKSEKVTAYELGYRTMPLDKLSLSFAMFYNEYRELRSINMNPGPPPVFIAANDQRGKSRGVELFGNLQAAGWWRLRGGYTYIHKNMRATTPGVVAGSDVFEGNDPLSNFLVQSIMNLPKDFELDVVTRHVATLPSPHVARYLTFDIRLARQVKNTEFAVVGQNLRDNEHPEFGPYQIPRSVYGKLTLRY